MRNILKHRAITLTELLVGISLISLVLIPAGSLYRNMVRSSVTGILINDLMNTGKRISAQIHDDLQNSCLPYRGAFQLSFDDLLQLHQSEDAGLAGMEICLYRYPRQPVYVKESHDLKNFNIVKLTRVCYRIEKSENSRLLKLIRTETFPGQPEIVKVLSDKLNFFKVSPLRKKLSGSKEAWFWDVAFQLATLPQNMADQKDPITADRSKGILILDFFDLAYSEFYNSLANNQFSPRNWNTGLVFQF
ncbi:MAG: hypothetical protein A2W80_02785 [Candidatus Riflebacteria bacterium GWC2_50_8]|nr:MAG: hypothetical protein A2W80_02785 [Candidatus Riflebacteria bacterium GWC2_50_8]